MAKHVRNILPGTYDVQNTARCHKFGERHCSGICPRHDAPSYADHMARHATDSIIRPCALRHDVSGCTSECRS